MVKTQSTLYWSSPGHRRDAVPPPHSQPARRLRRSHLSLDCGIAASASTAVAATTGAAAAAASTSSLLGPLRPYPSRSIPAPAQQPFRPVLPNPNPRLVQPKPTPTPTPTPAPKQAPPPAPASIQRMLFCASLENDAVWAPAAALLAGVRTEPRWDKARLSSHDLAVHVVAGGSGNIAIRFALVTASDVGEPATTKKLQRLAGQQNGHAVVLFLLRGDGVDVMAAYEQLQIELQTTAISILPLTAVETLPATVAAFCGQLTAAPVDTSSTSDRISSLLRMYLGSTVPLSVDGAKRLVAACAAKTKTVSGQSAIVLGDVLAFCRRLKESGQLEKILGADDAVRMRQ